MPSSEATFGGVIYDLGGWTGGSAAHFRNVGRLAAPHGEKPRRFGLPHRLQLWTDAGLCSLANLDVWIHLGPFGRLSAKSQLLTSKVTGPTQKSDEIGRTLESGPT